MINNVQSIGQQFNDLTEVGMWHRFCTAVWRAVEVAGMARAADHLDQLAIRYESVHSDFAKEIRAASEFANRIKLS